MSNYCKLIAATIILVFSSQLRVCAQIKVSEELFTVEELVSDVLINIGCSGSSVSNIRYTKNRDLKGIGYFTQNGSDFAFERGIILSTGSVLDAEGPNTIFDSEGVDEEVGDRDLENALPTVAAGSTNDAVFIEFDFVPTISRINFDFLLASDEYVKDFPCNFADVFAFLLTDKNGKTTNLAVIPNSDLPISITNIHPDIIFDGVLSCRAANEQYFDRFNKIGEGATSYAGKTKVFTAVSDVIPNEKYSIKLVLADDTDDVIDTAVFLLEGSFDISASLGDDFTIAKGNALCGVNSYLLGEEFVNLKGVFVWEEWDEVSGTFKEIKRGDESTYLVTASGTYKVTYIEKSNCTFDDTVTVEFVEAPVFLEKPNNIVMCDAGNEMALFDMTPVSNELLKNGNFNASFHNTLDDAELGVNDLGLKIETKTTEVFVRLENKLQNSCYTTSSFMLNVMPVTISQGRNSVNGFTKNHKVCVNANGELISPLLLGGSFPGVNDYVWESDFDSNVAANTSSTYQISALTKPTQYVLKVVSADNSLCSIIEYRTTVTPIGIPLDFTLKSESPIFSNQFTISAQIPEASIGKDAYLYQLNDQTPQDSNTFNNLPSGNYTVSVLTASDVGLCSDILSASITLISYPRSFTPNNDGINDFWNIKQLNQEPFVIHIFNRYGKLLKKIDTQSEGWDGMYDNKFLAADDYWFTLEYRLPDSKSDNFEVLKGHFALLR
ncbi:T9SS type B sorting domain-containing protein [Aquimarina agarilytica]|uniref:T9SS type B sorting domain-containing protein n=1 Tax=Aquimarina agarilytica TaxID=1087449 RepID=UPI0012F884E3|nr:T9SS type B sorting domain-containing protein [Aquimarina agarilytica]